MNSTTAAGGKRCAKPPLARFNPPQKYLRSGCVVAFRPIRRLRHDPSVVNDSPRYSLQLLDQVFDPVTAGTVRWRPRMAGNSVEHHAADALALVHQIEATVDVSERHGMGDHRVDLDLLLHVPVDDLWYISAAARAAKGSAFPDPAGDELERARRDLLACPRDPDDYAHAPAAVAGFERLPHHGDVAGAVERVVGAADLIGAALGHVDEMGDEVAADLLRIDEM